MHFSLKFPLGQLRSPIWGIGPTKRYRNHNRGEGGLFSFFFGVGRQSRHEIFIDLSVIIYRIPKGFSYIAITLCQFLTRDTYKPWHNTLSHLGGSLISQSLDPSSFSFPLNCWDPQFAMWPHCCHMSPPRNGPMSPSKTLKLGDTCPLPV